MQANNKSNNGWILCPSKSFPGKFYYFNVVNGEAAWSLNEVENKSLNKDYITQRVADKSHSFPEPDSPPIEDNFTPFASNSCQPAKYLANMPSQRFGEPVFPKYYPSMTTPVFWAPLQMIVPSEAKKITSSRVTQTYEPDLIIAHSTDMPLSKRFSKPMFYRDNRFDSYKFSEISTPDIRTNYKAKFAESVTNQSETIDFFKYPKLQPFKKPKPISESEITGKVPFLRNFNRISINQKEITQSPSWKSDTSSQVKSKNLSNQTITRNLPKSDKCLNIDNQKATLDPTNKVDNSNGTDYNKLDSEDLRFLLVAKRRKSLESGDVHKGKKPKPDSVTSSTPRKKVTFNLDGLDISGSEVSEPKYFEPIEEKSPSIDYLRNLAKPSMNKDVWYLVVDTQILLDNYDFIDQYVQSDVTCKLLIPHVVRSDVETMSKGDCCGRHRIIVARQLSRRLAMPGDHIALQTPDIREEKQLVTNCILNCCIETIKTKNRHVVLITNDTVLLKKAKTFNINCYKLQDIKDAVAPAQKVTFDIKPKFHVNSDVKENLFLQNNINIDNNSKNIFNGLFKSTSDTILDDRLINITKPKNIQTNTKSTIQYESDTVDSASEIGRNIKDINLNGKVNRSLFDNGKQFDKLNCDNTSKSAKLIYIEGDIKKYYVKNKLMEDKIRLRIDEWICEFSQIMEDVLTDILMQNSSHYGIPPPWYLCEAIECIKVMYTQEPVVVSVVNKFSLLLFNCSCDKGKLKPTVTAKDFMKILTYGITLMQSLQDISPLQELKDAQSKLDSMYRAIEDPTVERDDFITPVVCRTDDTDAVQSKRCNFQKNRSDIILYLQKNFPQWKSYTEASDMHDYDDKMQMNCQNENPKIVRTFGKNLGLLKIDSTKNISMMNPPKSGSHGLVNNTNKKIERPKIVRTVNNINDMSTNRKEIGVTKNLQDAYSIQKPNIEITMPKLLRTKPKEDNKDDPKEIRHFGNIGEFSFKKTIHNKLQDHKIGIKSDVNIFGNDLNIPKHGNTFKVAEEKTEGPKVIRPFENVNSFSLMKSGTKHQENGIQPSVIKRELKNVPNVVKSMKLIDVFANKFIKKAKELNMDDLDYEIEDTLSNINNNLSRSINKYVDSFIDGEANNNVYLLNPDTSPQVHLTQNKYLKNKENQSMDTLDSKNTNIGAEIKNNENTNTTSVFFNNTYQNDNSDLGVLSVRDDSTNDSGFENESLQAYSLAKSFLTEISSSFKMIYKFIAKSIAEVRDGEMQDEKKKMLHDKANRTHLHIARVIEKLKSIIDRESNKGTTLKSYLIKAGEASGDKRMAQYRQVVTKSLEQAEMLENALKLLLNIINKEFDDRPTFANNSGLCLKYYNVFE